MAVLPHRVSARIDTTPLLEDRRLGLGLLFLAVCIAIGSAVWARRARRGHLTRHRHVMRVVTATAVAGLLALSGAAVLVNAYAGYLPNLGALTDPVAARHLTDASVGKAPPGTGRTVNAASTGSRSVPGSSSQVVTFSLGAPRLGIAPRPVYVYLPPGYATAANANRHYPALYLLHGYPGRASDWLSAGGLRATMDTLIASGLIQPMIVVTPQVNTSFFDDSECLNLPGKAQNETYLTQVVVDRVDANFRTLAARGARAIGGMSSGGFCALNLGLRHLAEYAVILASEPYGDPGARLIRRIGGLPAWLANSPRFYLPSMPFTHHIAVFLDAGSNDHQTAATADLLARLLVNRGQYVALRIAPGQSHTWTTARLELPYSLVFASQQLQSPPSTRAAPPPTTGTGTPT